MRPRRDNLQNFVQDQDETESLGTFSLETETRPRPRLSPISELTLGKLSMAQLSPGFLPVCHWCICMILTQFAKFSLLGAKSLVMLDFCQLAQDDFYNTSGQDA